MIRAAHSCCCCCENLLSLIVKLAQHFHIRQLSSHLRFNGTNWAASSELHGRFQAELLRAPAKRPTGVQMSRRLIDSPNDLGGQCGNGPLLRPGPRASCSCSCSWRRRVGGRGGNPRWPAQDNGRVHSGAACIYGRLPWRPPLATPRLRLQLQLQL